MTLGRPPLRVRFAGCAVPADRRRRMGRARSLGNRRRLISLGERANLAGGALERRPHGLDLCCERQLSRLPLMERGARHV